MVVQRLALRSEQSGVWTPMWSTVIGGGATSITLNCKTPVADEEFREMRIRYEPLDRQ